MIFIFMANVSFSDLVFIDKRGHDYGWSFDDGVWRGSVMIDKVSKGLFETEKIVCMQRYPVRWMSSESDGDTLVGGVKTYEYGKMSGNAEGDYFVWRWDDSVNEVNEINMFKFDRTFCPPEDTSALAYNEYDCPNIEFADEVRIDDLPNTESVMSSDSDLDGELKYIVYEIDNLVPTASVVDLCFCNEDSLYNTFRRDLLLFYYDSNDDTYTKVAEICVYAESVEEDERFGTLCANLGYNITNDDFKIFKDSDIKEQKVDMVLMNEKRKEMLMEGHNIYPYIGSYKSLINVIRYFGYDNIHIKEWWKNVDITSEDYGNYFIATSYSLVDREVVRVNGQNVSLPSKKFRKTNKMTLAWDIDRVVKEVYGRGSAHALPETEEVFAFTIEEAVIKLYAFRRKLEKEFLPLNCHIVDMVGEMFGFDYNVIRLNVSDSKTFNTYVGCTCDFNVITEEEDVYLEDLRRFNVFNENVSQPLSGDVVLQDIYEQYIRDYNALDTNDETLMPIVPDADESFDDLETDECVVDGVRMHNGKPISLLGTPALYDIRDTKSGCVWNYYEYALKSGEYAGNYYVANFSNYYPNLKYTSVKANTFTEDMNEHLPDNENALCGALVRLQCTGLGTTWDEALCDWDSVDCSWYDSENYIKNHQRITWEIWKPEDDTPEFFASITGEFRSCVENGDELVCNYGYGDIGIMLPYVGKYSVRCVIRGFDNSISERIKTECITVLPKNVEITGWYKHKVETYSCWNEMDNSLQWNTSDFSWDFPYIACDATWDEMRTATYESLNRATFTGEYYDSDDLDERMVVNTFEQDNNDEPHSCWNGMYFWDNLASVNWLALEHLDWNSTVIGGDIRTHFVIGGFDTNGMRAWGDQNLVVEVLLGDNRCGRFAFGENNSGDSDVVFYTNMLNECADDVMSEFEYHYFTPFNRNAAPYDAIDCDYYEIIAIAKSTGLKIKDAGVNLFINTPVCTNGIWRLSPTGSSTIAGYMRRWFSEKVFNPSWIDTTYMNTYTRVPVNTDINLNYSVSRINGKCCPRWEVRNLDNQSTPVMTSTHKNFHHLFRDTGRYNVRLELSDTNGNKYVSDRCMFEVI